MNTRLLLKQRLRTAALCLLVGLAASCATVPETGRRQLMIVSPSEEMQLGFSEFQKMKKDTPICHDPAINELVTRVGKRISAVVPLPGAKWEFVVFDEPKTANAFCLPGGKVGVYTGILPITKDEIGLATVLGHEISHAVARHGGERMSEALGAEVFGMGLAEAMHKQPAKTQALVNMAYGTGGTLLYTLPHSRQQEAEADHLGLIYMARAGYDPRGALDFWKRFATYNNQQGSHPIQFLSDHPVDQKRIANIEAEMPLALAEYHKATGK